SDRALDRRTRRLVHDAEHFRTVAAADLIEPKPGQVLSDRVHENDAAANVACDHAITDALERLLEPFALLRDRLGRAPFCADVMEHQDHAVDHAILALDRSCAVGYRTFHAVAGD